MGRTSLEQTTNHRGALSVGGREGVHQVGQEQGGLGRDILALVRNSTKLSNRPQLREMGRFVGRGVMIRQRQQMGFLVGWSQWQAREGSEWKHWATHQRRTEANNGAIQVSLRIRIEDRRDCNAFEVSHSQRGGMLRLESARLCRGMETQS